MNDLFTVGRVYRFQLTTGTLVTGEYVSRGHVDGRSVFKIQSGVRTVHILFDAVQQYEDVTRTPDSVTPPCHTGEHGGATGGRS